MTDTTTRTSDNLDALTARLDLVDPTDRGRAAARRAAPRLKALTGARIALLENRKPNARELLQELSGLLIDRAGVAAADVRSKFIYSRPAATDVIEDLAHYDGLVTAIGD